MFFFGNLIYRAKFTSNDDLYAVFYPDTLKHHYKAESVCLSNKILQDQFTFISALIYSRADVASITQYRVDLKKNLKNKSPLYASLSCKIIFYHFRVKRGS